MTERRMRGRQLDRRAEGEKTAQRAELEGKRNDEVVRLGRAESPPPKTNAGDSVDDAEAEALSQQMLEAPRERARRFA